MYKGLVIKITKEYAVVLTEDNQYCKIILKDGLAVGRRIFFLEEDLITDQVIEKETYPRSNKWQKVLASSVLAASLLFFFVFGNLLGFPKNSQAYYAVISVDINPSVEMKIDKDRFVINVAVLNQEGYQVAGQYLVGQKLEDAIESIVRKADEYNYLAEQDTVLLAAAVNPDNAQGEVNAEELINELMEADLPQEYAYLYVSADQGEYFKAQENELSLGKYEMMVLADKKIEPKEIKKMKVKELLEEPGIKAEVNESKQDNPNKDMKQNKHVWIKDKRDKDNNGKDSKEEEADEKEDREVKADLAEKNGKDKYQNKDEKDGDPGEEVGNRSENKNQKSLEEGMGRGASQSPVKDNTSNKNQDIDNPNQDPAKKNDSDDKSDDKSDDESDNDESDNDESDNDKSDNDESDNDKSYNDKSNYDKSRR